MNAYHPFRLGLVLTAALCLAGAMPATALAATTKTPAKPTAAKATPAKAIDIDGYKGMRWGSSLADLQRTKSLVLTKENQADGSSLYALLNEDLRFGKASLSGIHCSFAQDRLQGVILLFSGAANAAAMKTEAMARFGESVKIDQKGDEMYSWVGKATSILLSYSRRAQTGFLFIKPKNPLKPVKTAKPTQAAQPAQPVKPQKPAEIRPAPPVEDIETALDRASMPDAAQVAAPVPPVSASPSPAPSYPSATTEPISPEIQRLIDRDRVLTRQCWGGGDAAANEACRQMRLSVKELTSLGMCMSPGNSSSAEPEVIWSRCGQQQAAAPTTAPAPAQENPKDAACSLVAELFAAAAEARQEGATPMVAEEELLHYQDDQRAPITIETIRETVELVYFDPAYAAMEGNQLAEKAGNACRSGRGPYARPLPQR
jgi:hypothetical protein